MSVNSSSSSNASSSSSSSSSTAICYHYRSSVLSFISFSAAYILVLLPVCVLVLFLGLRRWQKQRSTGGGTASHSDVFTYHMVAMEMMGVFACGSFFCGVLSRVSWLTLMGIYIFSVTSNGQVFFHVLTCTERYLAVIHPIIYLRLKRRGGVRIRNVSIVCAWLLFLALFGVTSAKFSTVPLFSFLFLSTAYVSFCSLSVLRALIRPGPGDRGKDKERVNQSKMKAFHTIAAITAALMFRFSGHGLVLTVYSVSALDEQLRCAVLVSGVWFCLPSSAVLPLLFLHRAGLCCRKSAEAVQSSQST